MILSLFLCLEISYAVTGNGEIQHKSARILYSRFPIEILSIA